MEITVEMVKEDNKLYEEIKKEILESVKEKAGAINSKLDDCITGILCITDNLFVLRTHYFEEGVEPKNKVFDNALYLPETMLENIKKVLEELNCYDVLG